jgi:hypothetical protein
MHARNAGLVGGRTGRRVNTFSAGSPSRRSTDKKHSTLFGSNYYVNPIKNITRKEIVELEDGRKTNAYFQRLVYVEVIILLLCMMGLGLAGLQYELEFRLKNEYASNMMLWFIFISSIVLIPLTV